MTEKELFQEIGSIKEEYLTEAEEYKANILRSTIWKRTLATAACLAVCFGIYQGIQSVPMNESATAPDTAKQENLDYRNSMEAEAEITQDALPEMEKEPMWEEPKEELKTSADSMQEAAEPETIYPSKETDEMAQMESIKEDMVQTHWKLFLEEAEAGRMVEIDLLTEALEGKRLFFDGQLFYITPIAVEDKLLSDKERGESYTDIYVIQQGPVTQIILSNESDLTQEQVLSGEYATCLVAEYETKP